MFDFNSANSADCEAMDHVRDSLSPKSSCGGDNVFPQDLLEMDNDKLCDLFNECLRQRDSPLAWLITRIIALLKKGKDAKDPDGYRAIGLESVVLKMMTYIIHKKLLHWANKLGAIPPSQNGFRPGFRTNNNVFILRTMIEQARAEGKTLWVGFVDISNAFPSTDRTTLWLKLHKLGFTGKMFDWLRNLYRDMSYVVQAGGELSEEFRARMGVLMGDPASPTLWILFMHDFNLDPHDDDMCLAAVAIAHLEHADDLVLASSSAHGLQQHFSSFVQWCRVNFLIVNALKSWVMVFGPLPNVLPRLYLGSIQVKYRESHTYVGVTLRSSHGDIFADHYDNMAKAARKAANGVLSTRSLTGGVLPPTEGHTLYTALVDPYLISGADVILDVREQHLHSLSIVQVDFLRELLGLNNHSMLAPLFTELAILPLAYHRVLLTLSYLKKLVSLPPSAFAHIALMASAKLADTGHASWVADLAIVLAHLPIPVQLPPVTSVSQHGVDGCILSVKASARLHLQRQIDASPRLYLLHDCLEPLEGAAPAYRALFFRHYLRVPTKKHRVALTRLILSDHCLAVEHWQLRRHASFFLPSIPREDRLCRLCLGSVETPEHALLLCMGSDEVVSARSKFFADLIPLFPSLPLAHVTPGSARRVLKTLIFTGSSINLVAKFVWEILQIFGATPMYIPVVHS